MRIGVFDSGIGGEAIAQSLRKAFPDADILCRNDRDHVPYGDRSPQEIAHLTDTAIQPLLRARCDVIVIACNSATAAAIETLRTAYPTQAFIGLEPMIKPALNKTQTGTIAVCATPATLSSDRYRNLKDRYASGITVLEPDCRDWAAMIEHNRVNVARVADTIDAVCQHGADVIVLACTHYHWIEEVIDEAAAGRATILNPSDAIARRVAETLETR